MFHFCVCVMLFLLCFFFFKQKTAYMMRISDGSSDVCSSYLNGDSTSSARTERKNALFAPWRERFLWRPSDPQHPVDPLRHQRGRRPVPRLVEPVTALARREVQLQRPRPARPRPAYETRGGIDRALGADRQDKVGAGNGLNTIGHPVRRH